MVRTSCIAEPPAPEARRGLAAGLERNGLVALARVAQRRALHAGIAAVAHGGEAQARGAVAALGGEAEEAHGQLLAARHAPAVVVEVAKLEQRVGVAGGDALAD